jgi:hypothetical protein
MSKSLLVLASEKSGTTLIEILGERKGFPRHKTSLSKRQSLETGVIRRRDSTLN